MPVKEQFSVVFNKVLPGVPEHLLPEDAVATATNIDFSAGDGAARVRRGSWRKYYAGAGNVTALYRHQGHALNADSYYFANSGASGTYAVYQGTTGTFASVKTGLTNDVIGINSYKDRTYIALTPTGSSVAVDTGGVAEAWPLPAPSGAPVVTVGTLAALSVLGTYTITEGTGSAAQVGTCTASAAADTYRLQVSGTPTSTNLNVNGTNTVGDYGIHSVALYINNPEVVTRMSLDYSIDDTTFENYYHAEMDVVLGYDTLVDPETLVDALIEMDTSTAISAEDRERAISEAREVLRMPVTKISAAKDAWTTWTIQRPNFQFIGSADAPEVWTDIKAVRLVMEGRNNFAVVIKDWQIKGAIDYPLNDVNVGYAYWETWQRRDSNGYVIDESVPSAATTRLTMQHAQSTATFSATAPTPWTHHVLYAQGGYMRAPYAVSTVTGAATTAVHNITDIKAISQNYQLNTGLRTALVGNVTSISKPFKNRLFYTWENKVGWTFPGRPTQHPQLSNATVSHMGDHCRAVIPWGGRLVIVNRDSVYEMAGNIFEGDNQDWTLTKSGARHGSIPYRVPIETPYGIPMLDFDGFYMYMPGQGVETEIAWAANTLRDFFTGPGVTDPAYDKGQRIPVLAVNYITSASSVWYDGKLYLAVATGADTTPKTVLVFDFRKQHVSWYTFSYSIFSMFVDRGLQRLLVGSTSGVIFEWLSATQDQVPATGTATNVGIPWNFKTRKWTTPGDLVLENLAVECEGTGIVVNAIVDNTSSALGTITSGTRARPEWQDLSLDGRVCNSLQFEFSGTKNYDDPCAIYGMQWDTLVEPKQVNFFRTEYNDNGHEGEKVWDIDVSDIDIIGTGTVTKVSFVDGAAVMTNSLIGATAKRVKFHNSFPNNTFGDIAYSTYTSSSGVNFKLWNHKYFARNEPPPVTKYRTDIESLEEFIIDAVDADIDTEGTAVLGVCYVDGSAVGTATFDAKSTQQSYTWKLPVETYGRTLWVEYAGASGHAFKHYKTWFHKRPQPDRWTNFVSDKQPLPANYHVKTWLPTLDCLGGSVIGTCMANGTAISTETFTGTANRPHTFNVSLEMTAAHAIENATEVWAIYNAVSTGKFKHFNTNFETEVKPFGKKEWTITYKKLGGATELDMARYWTLDAQGEGTATLTSMWDIDGSTTNTETFTLTNRQTRRAAFPPGERGRLFQVRLWSSQNFQVYKSNLDIMRVGVKGFSRTTIAGSPSEQGVMTK